jgi:cytochrome P450
LRDAGNWAYLRPVATGRRRGFYRHLGRYLDDPQPGSLAASAAADPRADEVDAVGQIPHWLFAYDAAGMTLLRTLAALAGRSDLTARLAEPGFAALCVHETLRLWPTTLVILRETTRNTTWHGIDLPAGTTIAILSGFLHRRHAPSAYTPGEPSLAFSTGSARCPGEDLVGYTTGLALTTLAAGGWRLHRPALAPGAAMPAMLDHFRITLRRSPAVS